LILFLLAPAIALFIAAFVVQSYQVDGQSMEPTLQDNDRLIVNKWPRSWARVTKNDYLPNRSDVIIFNQSAGDFGSGSKQLIKRVIGLPGERVVVADGKITIYNDEHPDGFNPDATGSYKLSTPVTAGSRDVTLQPDEIFVCGDNRANSEDSRVFGPVHASQIVGKLAFRIVPLDKAQQF
jgi:signal peptidase I